MAAVQKVADLAMRGIKKRMEAGVSVRTPEAPGTLVGGSQDLPASVLFRGYFRVRLSRSLWRLELDRAYNLP